MKKYLLLALMLTALTLTGCKGVLTGHNYTSEEISQISKFLSVSEERIKLYKDGDITIEELGVSADRMRQAMEFAEKRKLLPK